jgi:hypothetical protein
MLRKSELKSFLDDLLFTLDENGIKLPKFHYLNYELKVDPFNKNSIIALNTPEFFKDKRFEYQTRLFLSTDNSNELLKDKKVWFEFFVLFKTYQLAKDKENDDYIMSDYEYSEEAKAVIKRLSENLYKAFPDSYVTFTNEYNDCDVCSFIKGFKEESTDSMEIAEMAILPKTDLGNSFVTKGTIIDNGDHRVLISRIFQ